MGSLDNLRKTAKRWLKALRDGDAQARERYVRAYANGPSDPGLRDVQYALARERGYESWTAMVAAVSERSARDEASPLAALLAAAAAGDGAAVAGVLDTHPDVINERGTLRGHSGLRTALHFGVRHEPVVRLLLERGADANIRDEGDNAFPLHFAAERGDLPVVKLLIEHGADPAGADTSHELDVLGWAVCFEYATNTEVARYLLGHGASHTLFSAVAMGDVDAVRRLAAQGADVNKRMDRTNQRRTPLHLALVKKQPSALAALLDAGADPNVEDASGLTPLDQAALDGESGMAQTLIERGAEVRLPAAIALDRHDDIERIVGANPEALGNNRRWARLLVRASARARRDVIEALLRTARRHRAGLTIVNMADDEDTAVDGASGYTALHAAAFTGNDEAVDVLLANGANPRARDGKYHGTPAGWAQYAGHPGTAARILAADVDIFDAINFDRADIVERILDRDPAALDRPFKAYADSPSRDGQWWPKPDDTPLQWATSQAKQAAIRALTDRGASRTPEQVAHAERVARFLRFTCWDHHVHGKGDHRMYDRAAQRILAQHPEIARADLYTAIVCGEIGEVERTIAARPAVARERGGSRGWTPLLYLCYTRFTHQKTFDNAVAIARLLLEHGADPNAFYMAGDSSYTALVGAAGEGEQDSPRQPYAAELYRLLLAHGAGPYDIQVLYDTHFSGDVLWWLELTYEHTATIGRKSDWSNPDWPMLDMGGYGSGARFLLGIAIKKNDLRLAEWLLSHGANPNAAPARDRRSSTRSLYEDAVDRGLTEMASLLARYGADPTVHPLNPEDAFVAACLRGDRAASQALVDQHPQFLRSPRAMFEAARRDRPDAIAVLLNLGMPLEIEDPSGKTRALHHAAANDALRAAAFLIDRGAEIDPRDAAYNATPIGWAAHGDKVRMVDFLSRYSRAVWTLAFRGYVDRLREVLVAEPALAREVSREGYTPLWWLPDDEEKAMTIVELLLAAGADPRAKGPDGETAADWARERGMTDVARRLDAAAANR